MNFKPEGLILPDCKCFREKAKIMNGVIDGIAAHKASCDAKIAICRWCYAMKEYWVNVYERSMGLEWLFPFPPGKITYEAHGKLNYRLHVREFESREAKELYLKLKYGNRGPVISFNFVQLMNRELVNEYD